jgi:hypothetical protein
MVYHLDIAISSFVTVFTSIPEVTSRPKYALRSGPDPSQLIEKIFSGFELLIF